MRLSSAVAIGALIVFGCSPSDNTNSRAKLESLLLSPSAFPDSCHIAWQVQPKFMEPTEKHPDDFLGFVVGGFWFKNAPSVDLSDVVVGVSNVYSTPGLENAIVNISLFFRRETMAAQSEEFLRGAYARPDFFVDRDGPILSWVAPDRSLSEACAEVLRAHIRAQLGHAG